MPTLVELTSLVKDRLADDGLFRLPPPLGAGLKDDIELWMTYLSQDQPWLAKASNQYNKALATHIESLLAAALNNSIAETVTVAMPPWLAPLIHAWHQGSATVITLNYDTLVERAAISGPSPVRLRNIYPEYFVDISSLSGSLLGNPDLETFSYHKLHGSLNWHYSGRDEFYGEQVHYSGVTTWGGVDSQHELRSRNPAAAKAVLIIPPVTEKTAYFTNEYIRTIWTNAGDALTEATRVFVIGYSLPRTDIGMGFFLANYVPKESTPWYIINPDKKVLHRFRDLLPSHDIPDSYVGIENPVPTFVRDYTGEASEAPQTPLPRCND